ncbi:MAG: ketopantoate reductase family protein [Sandaracinus sp.]|nr:ketopantoate reductase family protein [Sandaracinus sp.]MCB9614555.1 ketopantoate reductase family protein [Sandaracinus sp.]MCB9620664.1 ketopantoate reductase family protein [Sandaracinus sp.]MCB9622961.1 ketopantoate reductase family protein [Sandaracinus sp.]
MARILVVGCGAIGGLVAARLTEHHGAEHEVEALTTNDSIADAITRDGLRVVGVEGESVASVRAVRSPSGTYDFVLLATQPPQVEAAARDVVDHLAGDGAMVCFQNGLVEERIAPIAGSERVLGGVIAWGASMQAPGVVERTSHGGFALGRFAGEDDTRLRELATLLEVIGPVDVEPDLAGARWSKLAINCAISTLGTIGGDRLGALMKHRVVRRLALELMTETVEVARAEGVKLRKVSGTLDLDWLALRPEERRGGSASLVAKHSLLLAVGARYRKLRSSMLYAIERGREPAVDFLNGEVVTRGEKHGLPTPVSAEAQRTVHAIARGEHAPSMETLRELAARVL